ncbi:MAG: DUF4350 domain-containing protein [Actinomycetota bacterium]|nr:DUF4350 domain-containing protein [Actinomycetota bacterium]
MGRAAARDPEGGTGLSATGSTATRIALVAGAVVVLNLVVALLAAYLRAPGGPPSSSYATTERGLAAYASLLEEFDYEIERYRRPLGDEPLDPDTTVVLLDPPAVPPEGAEALGDFVERGGRLVAGGSSPYWLEDVLAEPPQWQHGTAEFTDAPGFPGIRLAGEGTWLDEGSGSSIVGRPGASLVVELHEGRGVALLLADVSPLQNRMLDEGSNAALGLELAGPGDRAVVFVESVHGYGLGAGLAALPSRWKWTLALLGLSAALWMWARAMRLGPPEQKERVLPPPRRAYVEALAATLARTERARRGKP